MTECEEHGHDWCSDDRSRMCRRCPAREYSGDRCFNGHDWANYVDLAVCRECGLRYTYADSLAGRKDPRSP